jgi:LacI family transcriptional regulator
MQKGPTINDVARVANVSNMTVSRVLNGSGYVSARTRKCVEQAISELGYQPNSLAQGMRTNTTRTVGFILPDITNSTNATVAQTVEGIFAKNGYRLLLGITGFDLELEAQFFRSFQQRTVDGVIAVLADERSEKIHALLQSSRVPIVVIDRDLPFAIDTVWSEHKAAMREVVRYLTGLGHRHIALVMSPLTMRPGHHRVDAFVEVMRDLGLDPDPSLIRWERQLVEDGYRSALDLLQRTTRPTALVVGANQQTFGALQAIRDLGLKIPHDLSIVGADENLMTSLVEPPLTIIWRDMELIGRHAATLLLERLKQPARTEVRTVTVNSEVILRQSCAPPNIVDRSSRFRPANAMRA